MRLNRLPFSSAAVTFTPESTSLPSAMPDRPSVNLTHCRNKQVHTYSLAQPPSDVDLWVQLNKCACLMARWLCTSWGLRFSALLLLVNRLSFLIIQKHFYYFWFGFIVISLFKLFVLLFTSIYWLKKPIFRTIKIFLTI